MVQARQRVGHFGSCLQCVDRGQLRLDGFVAQCVDGGSIHAGPEIIAYFLLHRRAVLRLGIVSEDAPQKLLVLVGQLGVDAPACLVGGNGIVFLPATTTEFVEVGTWVDGLVEARHIQGRGIGHCLKGLSRLLRGQLNATEYKRGSD